MRVTSGKRLDPIELDMTPMIDMTFQLIAFFMVALNFSEADIDQRVNLPGSELAKPPDVAYQEPITIQIAKEGVIVFGMGDVNLAGLKTGLLREAQMIRSFGDKKNIKDVTVIIRADQTVRTGLVQEVIKACQDAEFENFALRSKQSEDSVLVGG